MTKTNTVSFHLQDCFLTQPVSYWSFCIFYYLHGSFWINFGKLSVFDCKVFKTSWELLSNGHKPT